MNTAKKAALALAITGVAVGASAGTASAGTASAQGASAVGKAKLSPGVISGNVLQVPIDIPIQLVGNSLNVVGILNPAFGNTGAIV